MKESANNMPDKELWISAKLTVFMTLTNLNQKSTA